MNFIMKVMKSVEFYLQSSLRLLLASKYYSHERLKREKRFLISCSNFIIN